ncbi:MAG: hypothetical protein HY329_02445 [Chloroflexi bacterium]|nr:hypothetical protein [Chloroflexota bacterium]
MEVPVSPAELAAAVAAFDVAPPRGPRLLLWDNVPPHQTPVARAAFAAPAGRTA